MREKLVTALVGSLVTIALILFVSEAPTDKQEVINKLIGVVVLALAGIVYKYFEKKGVFDKTYEQWRKEFMTNK